MSVGADPAFASSVSERRRGQRSDVASAGRSMPRPFRIWGALTGVALGGISAAAGLLAAIGHACLPAPGFHRLPLLALVLAIVATGTSAIAAFAVVRRTRPLFRNLRRAPAGTPSPVVPPSEAAVRDAFFAPTWMAAVIGASVAGVLMVELAGVWPRTAPDVFGRTLVSVLAASVALAAGDGMRAAWKRVLWGWLREVPPQQFPLRPERGSGRRTAIRLAIPVGVVASGASAVVLAHLKLAGASVALLGVSGLSLALVCVASAAMACLAGTKLGNAAEADVEALMGRVRHLSETDEPSEMPSLVHYCRTQAGYELGAAVAALADRYAASVTEEARARAAVERAQRLKSRFMAYMSHDLRSPLNSIRGFADVLARGQDGPINAEQRESIDMIRESGDELLALLDAILDSAKLEAGRLPLRPAWTPSVEIFTEAVQEASALARARSVRIDCEFEPGLPPVRVDRDRVVQAVAYVLTHVVRVMDDGTVTLRARLERGPPGPDRQLRVEIIDSSAGIREEDRERLFEAFRTIRQASGRRVGGLGLGLSLCRALITAHAGDVWFERASGRTTVFCVALPVQAAERPR